MFSMSMKWITLPGPRSKAVPIEVPDPPPRRRIAGILGVAEERVWLKAKTGERVGPIGEELAIGAECVVLLEKD